MEKEPAPVKVDGRTYTFYQATQYQRRLERELREFKRQYLGGQNMTAAITAKEQQYARFCEKAGLKQNLNRLYVKGYKRDFEYIKQNSVEYPAGSGKIVTVKTRHGHKSNPRNGTPNSVIDHLDSNGMLERIMTLTGKKIGNCIHLIMEIPKCIPSVSMANMCMNIVGMMMED